MADHDQLDHDQLLDEARQFCDPHGEVVQRMPDELMEKLRKANLARGIPGRPSSRTGTHATWFVFFDDAIRDRVLAECRAARKRRRSKGGEAPGDPAATPGNGQGLNRFLRRRKSTE